MENFRLLRELYWQSAGVFNVHSTCPYEFFERNCFWNKFFFSFLDLERFSGLLADKFRQVDRNWIVRVLGSFWEIPLKSACFSYHFSKFGEFFPAGLQKVHSSCPEEHFEKKFFLEVQFFNFYGVWRRKSQSVRKEGFSRDVKNAFY